MSAVVLETTATEILVFRIADCAFRAGGNADPVEITPCFVQYRPARDKLNRLLGANLHTFTTAAAELMVNNDSHNDYLISSCADRQVHILVKSTNSGQGVKAAKKIERNSMQILVFSYLLCYFLLFAEHATGPAGTELAVTTFSATGTGPACSCGIVFQPGFDKQPGAGIGFIVNDPEFG